MNYNWYISYAHRTGFGRCTIETLTHIDRNMEELRGIELSIERNSNVKDVVVLYYRLI